MERGPLLSWPKVRQVRDASGREWVAVIEPGRLDLTPPPGTPPGTLLVIDADELRRFALTLYTASIEWDQARAVPPGGRQHLKRQRARAAARDSAGRYRRHEDRLT